MGWQDFRFVMMRRKIEHCGDIESAVEEGRYEVSVDTTRIYSKDKDERRDREVSNAIKSLNYQRVKDEIGDIVKYTLEAVHNSNRYLSMLSMPHYAKITEDVIKDIYLKYYC